MQVKTNKIQPGRYFVLWSLAIMGMLLGASNSLGEAISIQPDLSTSLLAQATDSVLLTQADSYMDRADYQDAISAYTVMTTKISNSNKSFPKVLYYIGKCHYRLGKFDHSKQLLSNLVSQYSTSPYAANAQRLIGYIYLDSKDYPNALLAFQQYAASFPNAPQLDDVKERIAAIQHKLGMLKNAISVRDQVISSDDASDATKAAAQVDKAGLIFEQGKGEDKQYLVKGPADRDRLLASAREECQKVYNFNPSLKQKAIADLMTFESYYYQEDYDSVIQYGEKFFSNYGSSFTWPEDKDVLLHIGHGKFVLGHAKYMKQNYTGALQQYQDILSLWPEHPCCDRTMFEIAQCYYLQKNYTQAAQAFQQLIQTYPKSTFAPQAQQSLTTLQNLFLSPSKPLSMNKVNFTGAEYTEVACGPRALKSLLAHYELASNEEELAQLAGLTNRGTNLAGLADAAKANGLQLEAGRFKMNQLASLPFPVIAHLQNNPEGHFIVVDGIKDDKVLIRDLNMHNKMALSDFQGQFSGYALYQKSDLTKNHSLTRNQMMQIYGAGTTADHPLSGNDCSDPDATGDGDPGMHRKGMGGHDFSGGGKTKKDGKPSAKSSVIDLTNGQVLHIGEGLSVPSRGIPVQVDWRHLSFSATTSAQSGVFGMGTKWSYGDSLVDNGNEILWISEKYTTYSFRSVAGGYASPNGVTVVMQKYSNGTYSILFRDGTRTNFNTSGKLTSKADASGNQITFGYTGNNITSITDASSQVTNLYYDSYSRITAVKDPANRKMFYIYSGNNDLIVVTNPVGDSISYLYDSYHRMTAVFNPNKLNKFYFFNSNGWCTACQTVDGNQPSNNYTYSYGCDPYLFIAWIIDPSNHYTYFFYNSQTWKTDNYRDANGGNYYFTHDNNYNLSSEIIGSSTSYYGWSANRNLLYEVSGSNGTTFYSYDGYNHQTAVQDNLGRTSYTLWNLTLGVTTCQQDKLGQRSYFLYDSYGQCTSSKDAMGLKSFVTYDNRGLTTSFVAPDNAVTLYAYDGYGNLTCVVDPKGNTTAYGYDTLGRLTSKLDSKGGLISLAYDKAGNIISRTDAANNKTSYLYDPFSRLTSELDAAGNTITGFYNTLGCMTTRLDALGQATYYLYDSIGQLTTRKYGNGNCVRMAYDVQGNMVSIVDPSQGTSTFQYDGMNQMLFSTNPWGGMSYTYNKVGKRIAVSDPDGKVTFAIYDNLDRVSQLQGGFDQWSFFAYDAINRKTLDIYANGLITSYSYDNSGKPERVLNAVTYRPTDDFNRADSTLLGKGWQEACGNWSILNNQLTMDQGTAVQILIYNAGGSVSNPTIEISFEAHNTFSPKNGMLVFGYIDPANYYYAGAAANSQQLLIGNMVNGVLTNRVVVSAPIIPEIMYRIKVVVTNNIVHLYRLESNGWIERVSYDFGTSVPSGKTGICSMYSSTQFDNFIFNSNTTQIANFSYTYDLNGNRTQVTDISNNVTTYAYDSLNQLLQEIRTGANSYSRYYGYDSRGNRSFMAVGNSTTFYSYNNLSQLSSPYLFDNNGNYDPSGYPAYNWDYENMLSSIIYSSARNIQYRYDGFGRKINRIDYNQYLNPTYQYRRYIFDGDQPIVERESGNDVNYTTTASYTLFPSEPKHVISVRRNGVDSFYHLDPNGNVLFLTDGNGNTSASYVMEKFGNILASSGSVTNNYFMDSQEQDIYSGLYAIGSRWYDSSIGRFISRKARISNPNESVIDFTGNDYSLMP